MGFGIAGVVAVGLLIGRSSGLNVSLLDCAVFALLTYMVVYLVATTVSFSAAAQADIDDWAEREVRGTLVQRYVLGTAPGPGVSLFFALCALLVATIWLPGHAGSSLTTETRVTVAVALIVVGWASVAVSFAVTFYADNIVEDGKGLEFPGGRPGVWSDYMYFAVSVMTTFGTTDVTAISTPIRKTITVNAVIAFVFNAVTVAASVSALSG